MLNIDMININSVPDKNHGLAEMIIKNIASLPVIYSAFNILDLSCIGFTDSHYVQEQAQLNFLTFCTKITHETSLMCKKNETYRPSTNAFDFESLIMVKNLLGSDNLASSEMLILIKDKIKDLIDFMIQLESNSPFIAFDENDAARIRQEIIIACNRLPL
jgi:hypothetical protein